jgi:hypothetical protein
VQLQQLSVFSGHSLCRWPPPHHKHQGVCLQLAKVLSVVALCKASLSSVYLYHDDNMVKTIQLEYLLRFCSMLS